VKRQEISDCELTADIVLGLMADPGSYTIRGMTVLESAGPVQLGNNMPWRIHFRTAGGASSVAVKDIDISVLVDDGYCEYVLLTTDSWYRLRIVEDE
jgi:hypothetical protein